MKLSRPRSLWIGCSLTGILAVAVAMAQRSSNDQMPEAASAIELSSVFRKVSDKVLPGVVSLQVQARAIRAEMPEMPFGEDHPLNEFFRNDPRFRDPRMQQRRQGMGSGFIIHPDGWIMTNAHVIEGAEEITVRLSDGREFPATDWKSDPESDIAVVRIEGADDLRSIKLGDSEQTAIGDWVLAFGSPFGLDLSVTAGIISGKGRGLGSLRQEMLQTDAAINPGNSGGPLINLRGEVVGINTAISTRSGGYDGVGFVIPVNKARWIADQLLEDGVVRRAYLGVRIQPVTNELAQKFQIPPGRGAIVTGVIPESPADVASLKVGDVILEIAGRQVNSTRNLQVIVEQLIPDRDYSLKIQRDSEPLELSVNVVEMPGAYLSASSPESPAPDRSESTENDLGFSVQTISPQLRRQLDLENDDRGVIVNSVRRNSPADRAGLSVGTMIEKVGQVAVENKEEFDREMSQQNSDESVLLMVRQGEDRRFLVISP